MMLRFADFEIDTNRYELSRSGRPVSVEPMVFNLLLHLAKHPHTLFSREELMASVWGGRIVSDATISGCIKSVRKALGDNGDKQIYIQTVHGRGFRFVGEASRDQPEPVTSTPPAVGIPVRQFAPSLLVLPFKCSDESPAINDFARGLAEYMLADAKLIARKPKSLSMREAAALPLVGITAYEGLQRAGAKAGQKILVHGGAGGVDHVAVQLARHFGADVYATASGGKPMDIIEKYGATPINYKAEKVADYVEKHTNGAGFDVVFDSVGGANMTNSFEAAALNGQVVSTVSMLELDLTPVHFKGLSLHVVFMLIPMLYDHKREKHGAILAKLAQIADAGALKSLLDETQFNLEEVGKAHDRLTNGQAIGKVVIEI